MTDIVFLLLIFFILTSNVAVTGLEVDLPSSDQPKLNSVNVSVTIDSEGSIYMDEAKVTMESLDGLLSKEISKIPENQEKKLVVIRGDKGCDYGTVIEVYNLAQKIEGASAVLALKPN